MFRINKVVLRALPCDMPPVFVKYLSESTVLIFTIFSYYFLVRIGMLYFVNLCISPSSQTVSKVSSANNVVVWFILKFLLASNTILAICNSVVC